MNKFSPSSSAVLLLTSVLASSAACKKSGEDNTNSGDSSGGMATSAGGSASADTAPPTVTATSLATASVTASGLTLNWTKATDNITASASILYRVYRSSAANLTTVADTEKNGTAVNAATPNIATFAVIGLTAATTYYFNVVAQDAAGNKVVYKTVAATTAAATATATAVAAPGPFTISGPSTPTATAAPTVTWGLSSGASGYTVLVGTSPGCSPALQTFSAASGGGQALGALSDGSYYICVSATNSGSTATAASNSPYALTIKATPPGTFNITAFASNLASSATPTINWGASSTASGYSAVLATNSTCSPTVGSQSSGTTSYAVSSALAAGTYYACVTATDAVSNSRSATNSPYRFAVEGPGVVGQTGFTASTANSGGVGAATVNQPEDVYWDGSHFLVADYSNNRVLIYNKFPAIGQAADLVIGQPNMTTIAGGTTAAKLWSPTSVWSDGTRVVVADFVNARVLIWNTFPTTNGQAADLVLGQVDMVHGSTVAAAATTIAGPTSVRSDGTRLFVVDQSNNRVMIWNTFPTANTAAADLVLGQSTMSASGTGSTATTMNSPAMAIWDGSHFIVSEFMNHRVLIWNSFPSSYGQAANVVVGQPNKSTVTSGTSSTKFNAPWGIHSDGTRLFVAEFANNRVVQYNTFPTTDGQAADVVIGQSTFGTFTTNGGAIGARTFNQPTGMFGSSTGIYVADYGNNRVLTLFAP